MQCFLLGTGGMMPMPHRRLTSLALRHEGHLYLFDCGEGTQLPYKELHLGLRGLDVVAITHLHADHVLGLPGMLMLRAQIPDPQPLTVLGPPGLAQFIKHVRADLGMYINYPIHVIEWQGNDDETVALSTEQATIHWRRLNHSVLCLGYRFAEHQRPGRFDPEAAIRLNIPRGPLWGKLQAGQSVELPFGTVHPHQVLGPTRRGRQLTFATDTAPTPRLDALLEDADLAFLEGMFAPQDEHEALEKKHLTVQQAIDASTRAKVKRVVLVHISPRYDAAAVREIDRFARAQGPHIEVGRDGRLYELPLPADVAG